MLFLFKRKNTTKSFYENLIKLDACKSARYWAGNKSLKEIVDTCERGDWLLWLFVGLFPDELQLLTLAKGYCANTVKHLMIDERSIAAVDMAIAYGYGNATLADLTKSRQAAACAADADAADAAAYAANAAAYAACAADADAAAYAANAAAYAACAADADAAAYAANAANAAAYAAAAYAAAAYAADTKSKNQKETADICRKYLRDKFLTYKY